jgi:hypothetical protein
MAQQPALGAGALGVHAIENRLTAVEATLAQHTATLAQHTATLEQILAAVQGGGGALATQRAILRAVASNSHVVHHLYLALAVVPLETGAQPAHWPAGLTRAQLIDLGAVPIDALLADYGLPHGPPSGTLITRRRRLAEHIGVPGL